MAASCEQGTTRSPQRSLTMAWATIWWTSWRSWRSSPRTPAAMAQ
jgi:hypothetical protein